MKVYLDDERKTPEGFVRVCWPDEAIKLLETGDVELISLDHDLGDDDRGTGYDVLLWIEEQVYLNGFKVPEIIIHSSNSSARPFTKKNPLKKNSPYLFTRAACIAAANKSIHTIPVNTGETGERKPCQYSKEEKSGTETTRRQAASVSRSLLAQRTRSKHRSYTTNESLNCGA